MAYLGRALEKTSPSIDQVFAAQLQHFLYPVNALEPHQLYHAAAVPQAGYQATASFFAHYFCTEQLAGNLDKFRLWGNFIDQADLCFINMAVGKMLQQILESKNTQFFF